MLSDRSALGTSVLGLANILFPTSGAGDTVYQIVNVAADLVVCSILLAGDCCHDVANFGQYLQRGLSHFGGAPVT